MPGFCNTTRFDFCTPQRARRPSRTADPVKDRVLRGPTLLASSGENSPKKLPEDRIREQILGLTLLSSSGEVEQFEKLREDRIREQQDREAELILEAAEQVERCKEERRQAKLREQDGRAATEVANRRVEWFLKNNGFKTVNSKKSSWMKHKYPLHAAVEKKDADTIRALLRCGADPTLQNSKKETPEQLAASINHVGSQDRVLAVLKAHSKMMREDVTLVGDTARG